MIVLAGVFACCLSCRPTVSGVSGGALSATPSLAEELKLLKAEGLPTKPEDLQAPLPPSEQNAAPLYRQLVALLKAKPTIGDDKIATDYSGRAGLTVAEARQIRAAFQHRADIGRLIHRAVSRPVCVFDRQWALGAQMQFPEFRLLRTCARWLSAESALELYDGKPEAAIKTMALGFTLARHCAQDPMLIGYLVTIALDTITLHGMERILYVAGKQPNTPRDVRLAIESGWRPRSLAHGMRGEVIVPLIHIEQMRKGNPDTWGKFRKEDEMEAGIGPLPLLSPADRADWNGFIDRSEVVTLQALDRIIVAADKPYPDANRLIMRTVANVQSKEADAAYTLARIVFPVYSNSADTRARAISNPGVVEVAASVLEWRAHHGTYPERLSEAMLHVPADAFEGQPLRYRIEGKGFVVYSIGSTGKFTGGDPGTKPDAKETLTRYPMPVYLKH